MSEIDKTVGQTGADPIGRTSDESFLRRWSERKARRARQQEIQPPKVSSPPPHAPVQELTDADMPATETLDEKSDYSGFLSPKVSAELRRLALRKLFHSPSFNITDGLDDYDEDFTSFTALGNVVTQEMRHRLEIETRRNVQQTPTETEVAAADDVADTVNTQSNIETEQSENRQPENIQQQTRTTDEGDAQQA